MTRAIKQRFQLSLVLGAWLLAGAWCSLRAQTYTVPWFVLAAGGGTATNGEFSLSGTFAQWDVTPQETDGGTFSLTGGFWSFLVEPQTPENILFNDDFTGNTIDPTKWMVSGHTVVQSNGTMEVLTTVTDAGGVLTSVPFTVDASGLITITRQVYLHAQPGGLTNFPGTYFMGQFGISIGALPQFSIYYADFDYGDGVTYLPRHGFFLARDGQSPLYLSDQANISPDIAPMWDTWFNETVTYDPTTGIVEYFINNASQMTFNVGVLPPTNSPEMSLTFNAWGWWTGHEQLFQNLFVTQPPGVSNGAPAIAVGGGLAFGAVPVNAASNLSLTISNTGTAALTVSNITYPPGFSGAFSGAIAAGSNQVVPVTFAPLAVTNYGGTVTVVSGAAGGNTLAASGYGAGGNLVLTIDINGSGSVTPNLNGRTLVGGKNYTVRAVPKAGNVFVGWTGRTNTAKNPLTFTMQTNTLLEANFITSPFLAAKGTYNGLFSATNGVAEETAGMLKGFIVSAQGTYSGALLFDGANHPVNGTFSLSGLATNHIARAARLGGEVTVNLSIDLTGAPPQVTGTVAGTNNGAPFVADLTASRPATNAGAAEFTMVLAPTQVGAPGLPYGYGYVLISEHNSVLTLSGALADGTALNQTVPVDVNTNVPLYAGLYGNTGLVTGWIGIDNGVLTGDLDWIKKPAHTGLYTNGFTNVLIAQGAPWTNQTPALNLPAGQLNIFGGSLSNILTFDVAVSARNTLTKAANALTNSLTGTINPKTGLLTVTFGTGAGRATTAGKGAALQDTTNAAGYFLGKTNAGSVILTQ